MFLIFNEARFLRSLSVFREAARCCQIKQSGELQVLFITPADVNPLFICCVSSLVSGRRIESVSASFSSFDTSSGTPTRKCFYQNLRMKSRQHGSKSRRGRNTLSFIQDSNLYRQCAEQQDSKASLLDTQVYICILKSLCW